MTLIRKLPNTAKVDPLLFHNLPPSDPEEVQHWEGKSYLYTILTLPDSENAYMTFQAKFNKEARSYRFNLVRHTIEDR